MAKYIDLSTEEGKEEFNKNTAVRPYNKPSITERIGLIKQKIRQKYKEQKTQPDSAYNNIRNRIKESKARRSTGISGLSGLGRGVQERLKTRSKDQPRQNNSVYGGGSAFNPIYHGNTAKSKGANIFTQTSGSNPFTFNSNAAQPKRKVKSKTVYKY